MATPGWVITGTWGPKRHRFWWQEGEEQREAVGSFRLG